MSDTLFGFPSGEVLGIHYDAETYGAYVTTTSGEEKKFACSNQFWRLVCTDVQKTYPNIKLSSSFFSRENHKLRVEPRPHREFDLLRKVEKL